MKYIAWECGIFQVAIETPRKLVLLSSTDVKGNKTNTKSQVYCFRRLMLIITEIIKIDETPNLQRNSHISRPISKVLNSMMNSTIWIVFFCYRDLYRQLTSTVNFFKCFTTSIYQPLIQWAYVPKIVSVLKTVKWATGKFRNNKI